MFYLTQLVRVTVGSTLGGIAQQVLGVIVVLLVQKQTIGSSLLGPGRTKTASSTSAAAGASTAGSIVSSRWAWAISVIVTTSAKRFVAFLDARRSIGTEGEVALGRSNIETRASGVSAGIRVSLVVVSELVPTVTIATRIPLSRRRTRRIGRTVGFGRSVSLPIAVIARGRPS